MKPMQMPIMVGTPKWLVWLFVISDTIYPFQSILTLRIVITQEQVCSIIFKIAKIHYSDPSCCEHRQFSRKVQAAQSLGILLGVHRSNTSLLFVYIKLVELESPKGWISISFTNCTTNTSLFFKEDELREPVAPADIQLQSRTTNITNFAANVKQKFMWWTGVRQVNRTKSWLCRVSTHRS